VTKTIHVTQEDIDRGRPCDATHCPVARALTRTFRQFATVGDYWALPDGRGGPLPPEARRFVRRFDHQVPVGPFQFTVETGEPT